MIKFDPDYAIFGTIGGEIEGEIGETRITYSNKACQALFKDFRGMTLREVIFEVAEDLRDRRIRDRLPLGVTGPSEPEIPLARMLADEAAEADERDRVVERRR